MPTGWTSNNTSSAAAIFTGPIFTPLSISGCKLWLRADKGLTLSGSNVTTWADQSGNGNDLTNGSGGGTLNSTDSNFNNKPSISVSNNNGLTNSNATLTGSTTQTVYVVYNQLSNAVDISWFLNGANDLQFGYYSGYSGLYYKNTPTTEITSGGYLTNGVYVFSIVVNGASSAIYKNSSSSSFLSGTLAATDISTINFLGGSTNGGTPISGASPELIVYSGTHTQSQISQVFTYFATRYGGSWS